MAKASKTITKKPINKEQAKEVCGIIMPISAIDGCSEIHWSDVLEIISESIDDSGLIPNIVSNADEVGIIQKRIIQNLYENPIVVCDVSGKNPNVMFELGIRLAFDKPTIIIKDDKTSYSFDTSPIEHLEYPRDLRFGAIVDFKEKLSDKINKTLLASKTNADYTTFLKHFGEFKTAKINSKEVSEQEFIIDEIKNLRFLIEASSKPHFLTEAKMPTRPKIEICCKGETEAQVSKLSEALKKFSEVKNVVLRRVSTNHLHLTVFPIDISRRQELREKIVKYVENKFVVKVHQ